MIVIRWKYLEENAYSKVEAIGLRILLATASFSLEKNQGCFRNHQHCEVILTWSQELEKKVKNIASQSWRWIKTQLYYYIILLLWSVIVCGVFCNSTSSTLLLYNSTNFKKVCWVVNKQFLSFLPPPLAPKIL